MAIKLKDLNVKFYVIARDKHENGNTQYALYDPEYGSGRVMTRRFLDVIQFNSKRGEVYHDGSVYKDIDSLVKDIYEYANALPFHSDYYDPAFRIDVKELYCLRDYMKSIGFEIDNGSLLSDTFVYKGHNCIFNNDKYMSITIRIDEDKTSGTIMQNNLKPETYNWIESHFSDLNDAIGKINSLIEGQIVATAAKMIEFHDSLNKSRAKHFDFEAKKVDMDSMQIYTMNLKDVIIDRLENALNTLKNM